MSTARRRSRRRATRRRLTAISPSIRPGSGATRSTTTMPRSRRSTRRVRRCTMLITVTTADGTSHQVDVTINGANDAAVITGVDTGSVTEASGVLNGTAGVATATGEPECDGCRQLGGVQPAEQCCDQLRPLHDRCVWQLELRARRQQCGRSRRSTRRVRRCTM